MTTAQLLVGITILALLLLARLLPKGKVVQLVMLGVLFLFAFAQLDEKLGAFYTTLLSLGIIFSLLANLKPESNTIVFAGQKYSGVGFLFLSLLIGVGLFFFIKTLTVRSGTASILGIPTLAVSSGFKGALAPTLSGALGFIENLFFINLFRIYKILVLPFISAVTKIPQMVLYILGIVGVAGAFSIFHGFLGTSFSIFAILVFMVWLILSETPVGSTPANISHYLWNFIITIGRTLSIV